VIRGLKTVDLSAKEFALLEYFLRNPDRPLSRAQIAEHVWNVDFDSESNIIDVYVNHLRRKLEFDGLPRVITTVTGVGYVLRSSDERVSLK
jgi:DNA-binding response OmpR family regulator